MGSLAAAVPMAGAQKPDWANHTRYAQANDTITVAPEVVLMGNSITDFWPDRSPQFWQEHPSFCGRGISGQTSAQMLCRFHDDVLDLNPKVVVILAGTNDLAQNLGAVESRYILSNIRSMAELALANGMKVAVCSVPPAGSFYWKPEVESVQPIRELNAMISEWVATEANPDLRYVDYYSALDDGSGALRPGLGMDPVHPNAEGYRIMEQVLLQTLSGWLK